MTVADLPTKVQIQVYVSLQLKIRCLTTVHHTGLIVCACGFEHVCVYVCHFFQALSVINRAQIIDDTFNLAR